MQTNSSYNQITRDKALENVKHEYRDNATREKRVPF